jgi:hypothetical protein
MPVNVMAKPGFTVADLAQAGVKRISLGPWLANYAFGMLETAARDEVSLDGSRIVAQPAGGLKVSRACASQQRGEARRVRVRRTTHL